MFERKKVVKSLSLQLVEQAIALISGLLIVRVMSSVFGVQDYGVFQHLLAVVAIFISFTWLCGNEVIVPLVVREKLDSSKFALLQHGFLIRLVVGLVSYVLFLFYCASSDLDFVREYGYLFGLSILFQESFGVAVAWLQSEMKVYIKSLIGVAIYSVRVFLLYLAFIYGVRDYLLYSVLYISSFVVGPLVLFFYVMKGRWILLGGFDIGMIKSLLPASFLFALVAAMMTLFQRVDRLLLIDVFSPSFIGNYNASMQVVDLFNGLILSAFGVLAPIIYKMDNRSNAVAAIAKMALVFGLGVGAACVFVFAFSQYIGHLLFGDSFSGVGIILRSVIWISLPFSISAVLNVYMVSRGMYALLAVKWGVGCCVAGGLMLLLPSVVGWMGVVYSFFAAYVFLIFFDVFVLSISNRMIKS